MQYQYLGYRVTGFYRVADYALRSGMRHPDAQQRLQILRFFEKYGLNATIDAFAISRRTLYRWRAALEEAAGNTAALAPRSTAPVRRRRRTWPQPLIDEIRRLRRDHPNLGKAKLHPLLKPFCGAHRLPYPSESTLGRLIQDAPDKMRHAPVTLGRDGARRRARPKRLRKPKGVTVTHPGALTGCDTIERIRDGVRRYVFTFTDVNSRFGLAAGSGWKSSRGTRRFFALARAVFPLPLHTVLSDNGSEFEGEFRQAVSADHGITRWYTWPHTPKMNGNSRTLQSHGAGGVRGLP